jgi:hypothetical protein
MRQRRADAGKFSNALLRAEPIERNGAIRKEGVLQMKGAGDALNRTHGIGGIDALMSPLPVPLGQLSVTLPVTAAVHFLGY